MIFTSALIFWLILWAIILVSRVIIHATRNKVYEVENTKLYKAAKAKWDKF